MSQPGGRLVFARAWARSLALAVQVLLTLGPLASVASGATFQTEEEFFGGAVFQPVALSADGSVFVGSRLARTEPFAMYEAVRWTRVTGATVLGTRPQDFSTFAMDVSADGGTIAGYAEQLVGNQGFRWTETTGFEDVGFLPGLNLSRTDSISPDGSTLAGFAGGTQFPVRMAPIRWRPGNSIEELGYLPGGDVGAFSEAEALGVSADGSVVVGWTYSGTPFGVVQQAFRWIEAGGIQGLGFLPNSLGPQQQVSLAEFVSWDGVVVVGRSFGMLNDDELFRWTPQTGMVALGTLPGGSSSIPYAMNADGSMIVGYSADEVLGPIAFLWNEAHGMRSLQDVLENEYGLDAILAGWNLQEATLMSADGNVIMGRGINPLGQSEGFVVVLNAVVPEPSTLALALLGFAALLLFARRRRA